MELVGRQHIVQVCHLLNICFMCFIKLLSMFYIDGSKLQKCAYRSYVRVLRLTYICYMYVVIVFMYVSICVISSVVLAGLVCMCA